MAVENKKNSKKFDNETFRSDSMLFLSNFLNQILSEQQNMFSDKIDKLEKTISDIANNRVASDILSIKEAAEYIGVQPSYLYIKENQKKFGAIKISSKMIKFSRKTIDKVLLSLQNDPHKQL